MIEADTPNLWELRQHIGAVKAKAAVVYALVWAAELVNVERNLSEVQIGECASDILEEYGYLKMEEVKYVLKRAVRTNKIFGRLDYNIVMGWFHEYDAERTEVAVRISEQEATEEQHSPMLLSAGAMSFQEYIRLLEHRAAGGDAEAEARLKDIKQAPVGGLLSPDDRKREDFKRWKTFVYMPNKKNNHK